MEQSTIEIPALQDIGKPIPELKPLEHLNGSASMASRMLELEQRLDYQEYIHRNVLEDGRIIHRRTLISEDYFLLGCSFIAGASFIFCVYAIAQQVKKRNSKMAMIYPLK